MSAPSPPLRRLAEAARALGEGLAGLAYPSLCLGCEARISPADALCPSCLRGLPRPVEAPAVPERAPIDRIVALWTYDPGGTVRRVHHALKYGARPSLGVGLGRMVGAAVAETGAVPEVVTPVPLSKPRFLERGYNQAERLAEGVGQALGVPNETLLRRTRATRAQASLSKAERRQNVDGAFELVEDAEVGGRRVLLVDDVLTTGATLAAAARPLAEAGARVTVGVLGLAGW